MASARATLRDHIALGRPHTASLTIPGTLLGPLLAGWPEPGLYLALAFWALGFHFFGFLDNNLLDLAHDKRDPAKAHFPLVSGAIPEALARRLWIAGTLAFYVMGWVMLLHLQRGSVLHLAMGAAWMHLAILMGMAYNRASKRWKGAPVLIALSFASLPVFGYFLGGGGVAGPAIWYLFAFGFVLMFHQIAYSGYLKDLAPDPVNWLRNWGARAEPLEGEPGQYRYTFPPLVQAWGWSSRLLCPAFAFGWMFWTGQLAVMSALPLLVWTALLLVVFARLSKPGVFPRQRKVALMGTSEVLAYFILVASLASFMGAWSVLFYVGPLVWYVAWNKALWGTLLGPRV